MMNNKGQVLVLFILLIPVFLMLFAFVIDLGLLYTEDKKIESSINETIEYGLQHISDNTIEEKIISLLNSNIKEISKTETKVEDGYIYINVEKQYQGMFKFLFENNIYEINNSYHGYLNDGKIIINKE